MGCLDNIVSIGNCPTDTSTSGLTLLQAGGMNLKAFANIATDSSGIDMVNEKKQLAITLIKNDFTAALAAANVITNVVNPDYDTSYFDPSINKGSFDTGRGVVVHKNMNFKGHLRQTTIKEIQIYPFTSGDGTIQIIDGNQITAYAVSFIGGQTNAYDSTTLAGFPYVMRSKEVKVLILAPGVDFASGAIQCMTGCKGLPNPCGYADGWDGTKYVKSEAYGVNAVFHCECDYEQILCSNPALIGELLWLKWQILIFDEHYKSNRFNWFVTYNKESINEIVMPGLINQYNAKWQAFTSNMRNIIKTYNDSCLDCRGARWVVNM